ncbi:phosphoribosyltransferase [Mycobacterium sp. WMMD1722]|uniref:phosphoribosyltransferase n=1 Tax=Mycobacterium sp. WMMD1722 TaxID=3404117 RepID=UPI003BF5FC06
MSLGRAVRRTFENRHEAGRVLAQQLAPHRGPGTLVLGLARGGVPVAWEVARELGAPLDAFLVRKLGAPQWPELAMGAIASGGGVVLNERLITNLQISQVQVRRVIERETVELRRREAAYRGERPPPPIEARTVVLVDDGIATGASMLVAVRAVRARHPAAVVVGVPVGPKSACRELGGEADAVVCALTPTAFEAVGQVFADFHQVSDEEVAELLATPTC